MARSTVGVEDGVGLAEDGLGVEVDGLVVSLVAIGFVAGLLELGGILVALLLCKGLDNFFVDFRELVFALDGSSLGLGGVDRLGLGGFAFGFLALATLLFAELGCPIGLGLLVKGEYC